MTELYKTIRVSEWLNTEAILNLLRSNTGLYTILENEVKGQVEIVQIKNREIAETCMIRTGSLEETLTRMYNLREETCRKLENRRKNPVKEQINWWNTGKVMNRTAIESYYGETRWLNDKLRKTEEILSQLEQGTYEIRPVRNYTDLEKIEH